MRLSLFLGLVAACSSTPEPEPTCAKVPRSLVTNNVVAVASGRDLIGVSWGEKTGTSEPVHHAALVFPDGSRSEDVFVPPTHTGGIAGNTSVLWHTTGSSWAADIFPSRAFTATLQRRDSALSIDVTFDNTFTRSAVFDGVRYHLLWDDNENPRRVFHRTLDEDGTLGPLHQLGTTGFVAYTSAATDTNQIFLRVEETGYIVDTATGALTKIWPGTMSDRTFGGRSFYFDGNWYVDLAFDLKRISVATHAASIVSLDGAKEFYPTETSLYVRMRDGALFELDRDLQVVEQLFTPAAFGTFAGDRVLLEPHPVDPATLAPGYVDVAREGSVSWRTMLATDSPVGLVDDCDLAE